MKAPHFQYYAGGIEAACRQDTAARKRWTKVSKLSAALPSPEFVFPILADWKLDPERTKPKIAAALDLVRKAMAQDAAASKPDLRFVEAILQRISGQDAAGTNTLRAIVESSDDPWLRYLALAEMQQVFSPVK
jgi:hypothetical protein